MSLIQLLMIRMQRWQGYWSNANENWLLQIGSSTAPCLCVCVCVFPCQRQYIWVFQSNLSPVTVVRRSQVGLVTWVQSHEKKQTRFSPVFMVNFFRFFSEILIWEERWKQGTRRPAFSAAFLGFAARVRHPGVSGFCWLIIHTWKTSGLIL